MTIIAKTTLAAMKMPLTVEKDGQRYSLDIVDDEQGVDLVVERQVEDRSDRGDETSPPRKVAASRGGVVPTALMILGCLVTATSFADRTANQGWVTENFVSRTNEWKLAERRHALFVIDLNAENGGKWRSFELKASTNNFAKFSETVKTNNCFWGISDDADGFADAALPLWPGRSLDRMRLYWLTARGAADRDPRAWTKIGSTLDISGANPRRIAALVSPELCYDRGWLGEENEEIVWCYLRCDAAGPEKDSNGAQLWHPISPVKWYRNLPEWAR